MKEAKHYEKLEDSKVQCHLCPRNCIILPEKRGFCRVRENRDGKLYSLVYGRPCSVSIDPVEKKPLFHFLPGSKAFSLGTVGCNLRCKFCQNWTISQVGPEDAPSPEFLPEQVVEKAVENNCESIAYTYNEPTIFYEYVLETAKLAKKKGIKNIMVTNGYINEKPLKELYKYIDAANVDLKGFDDKFYVELSMARLEPVLETLKRIKAMKTVWLEVTNLVIPAMNDDMQKIKDMCLWIKNNLGDSVPLHFSRFFPYYQLDYIEPTPVETLLKAKEVAKVTGLKYVYLGNVRVQDGENTICPNCNELLVNREGYFISENNIEKGKCKFCEAKVDGVFD